MFDLRDGSLTRRPYLQIIEVDSREAQKAGLLRPLVRKEVEKVSFRENHVLFWPTC